MQLIIQSPNIELNALAKENIKKRARKIFSRIDDKIDSILISLHDVNGPKGGFDKLCKVIIKNTVGPTIVVSNRREQAATAVDLALNKACYNLIKKMKRKDCKKSDSTKAMNIEI